MKKIIFSVATIVALSLTGCGGGGGGSSSAPTALFPTNAVVASPTSANGEKLSDNLKNNSSASALNSTDSDSGVNTALMSNVVKNMMLKNISNNNALNAVIDENPNCEDGGTQRLYGSVNESTYFADLTITYNNCNEDNTISNGSVNAKIQFTDANYDTLSYITISLPTDLDLSGNYIMTMYKGTNISMTNFSGDNYKMTLNQKGKVGSEIFGSQNAVWQVNDGATTTMYQTAGKEYINNLTEYVTYDTNYDMSATPLVFNVNGDLTAGIGKYLAGSNSVEIEVTADNELTISVDTDGDGNYDDVTTKQYH